MAGECQIGGLQQQNEATENPKVIKIDMVGPSITNLDHRHDPR